MINKRNRIIGLFTFIIFSTMMACSDNAQDQEDKSSLSANDKEALALKIEALEDSLSQTTLSKDAKAFSLELLRSTTQFVDEFPVDQRCAKYMFMGARAASGLGNYEKSTHMMETIKKVYGNYDQLAEVYFLYAFILDEELNRKDDAKDAYMELVNKFPDDPLSAQAEVLLEQLYMSDEELIEKWSKQDQS